MTRSTVLLVAGIRLEPMLLASLGQWHSRKSKMAAARAGFGHSPGGGPQPPCSVREPGPRFSVQHAIDLLLELLGFWMLLGVVGP